MSSIVCGIIYSNGDFFEGFIELDGRRIIDVQEGTPKKKPIAEGLILPHLVNCHTHTGDRFLRGRIDLTQPLDKIVRPPFGVKHILLEKASDREIQDGFVAAMKEMRDFGTGHFIDFREGGLRGLEQIQRAIEKIKKPKAMILSRPEGMKYIEEEVEALLRRSDGIAVSSISDWDYAELTGIARQTEKSGKVFALHGSEAEREDIDDILSLKPDFIVHMTKATEGDLRACAEAKVPIIVCPRSNLRFGLPLDIPKMLDLGVSVSLGTDNAMLHRLSIMDEMRAAYSLKSNSREISIDEIFRLAVENSQKVLNKETIISIRPGSPCDIMVVKAGKDYSPEALFRSDKDYSVNVI